MSIPPPHSAAVLVDRLVAPWDIAALEATVEQTGIDLPIILVNEPRIDPSVEQNARRGRIDTSTIRLFASMVNRERAWALVLAERAVAERISTAEQGDDFQDIDDVALFDESTIQHVSPSRNGAWCTLPDQVVQQVASQVDLVIRFGFGLLRGDILTATSHGVLSFHPADIRRYRGLGPPVAFLEDRETIGITLQRLNDGIDTGEIVAFTERSIVECRTLWDVYDTVHRAQVELLPQGVANLREPAFEPIIPESLGSYYPVNEKRQLGFAGRVLVRNLLGRISSIVAA